MFYTIIFIIALLLILLVAGHSGLRILRLFLHFPLPSFLHSLNFHILKRFLPPDKAAAWHGLKYGNTVIEIGPVHTEYTMAANKTAGADGKIIKFDAEHNLSFNSLNVSEESIDAAYAICSFGKLQDLETSLIELGKLLKPGGLLAVTEMIFDLDYSFANTLIQTVNLKGFRLEREVGGVAFYTLFFRKGR